MYRCHRSLLFYLGLVVWLVAVRPATGGEPGYRFLRVGVTAKATALGDAYVAYPGDVTTVLYNPASVARIQGQQAAIGYMDHLLDISSGYVAYARPWAHYGIFGSSLVYFSYGDFEGYDVYAQKTGTFGVTDWSWNLFYAQKQKEWSYGINLKYIRSSIQNYSSSAVAMDIGMQYEYTPLLMHAGISILNIGQVTKAFIRYKDPLPLSLQMGVTKKLENAPLTVGLQWIDLQRIKIPSGFIRNMIVSAEINPKEPLFIRVAYHNQRRRDLNLDNNDFMNRIAGISAGIGYTYERYTLDYSFTSWGIGSLNRFTFSIAW